jgi:MinD superfamily P-loop ATPase
MNKFLKSGSPQMIKSDFMAYTNISKCINCGFCEEYCNFGARTFIRNKLHFYSKKCFGCGLCVSKCPEKAIILRKKSIF